MFFNRFGAGFFKPFCYGADPFSNEFRARGLCIGMSLSGEEGRSKLCRLPAAPLFPVVESVVEVQRAGARAEPELFGCRSLEFLEQVAEGLPRGEAHLPGYVGHASGILFQ